ncbi:hypothetical protein ESA94_19610 [Lacibacter luteus]|uniref:Uncharacterized protein n=1 Tax=Lacibacter luteus TaxID=2508719 RepID=A0A4Q1CE46_9BACT|nr:hypothetical protein [Lacibacter luteus]RXK57732.1 hypothetical protein ESA94_19610 [Lacibacter luteus]
MKKSKIPSGVAWLLLCLLLSHSSMAQQKKNEPAKPSWITMMDDPNVNYFEAVKSFNDYWKNKEKPVEEGELFESVGDKEKEEAISRKKARLRASEPAQMYAFEYKRFIWWMREMEPFVQPDGHIKGMDERINEWRTLQQQKKLQREREKDKPKQ